MLGDEGGRQRMWAPATGGLMLFARSSAMADVFSGCLKPASAAHSFVLCRASRTDFSIFLFRLPAVGGQLVQRYDSVAESILESFTTTDLYPFRKCIINLAARQTLSVSIANDLMSLISSSIWAHFPLGIDTTPLFSHGYVSSSSYVH